MAEPAQPVPVVSAPAAAGGGASTCGDESKESSTPTGSTRKRNKGVKRKRQSSLSRAYTAFNSLASNVAAHYPTTKAGRDAARTEKLNAKIKALGEAKEAVAAGRPRYLSADMQALVLHAHLDVLERRARVRKKKKVRAGVRQEEAAAITAAACGVARTTVTAIWRDFTSGKLLWGYKPSAAAASKAAATRRARIRDHQEVVDLVRQFVRERHEEHRQVTGLDVTSKLIAAGELGEVDIDNKQELDAAHRCVLRWLDAHEWVRGSATSKMKLKESLRLRADRAKYLKSVKANREGEKLREAFTDESYIYRDYHHDDRTIYDPHDKGNIGTKGSHYMVGVILGPDLTKMPEERKDTLADKGGWYAPAYEKKKFNAPLRRKHDSHSRLDAVCVWYETWFEKACKSLQANGHQCLWIMDSVPYHKATHFNKIKELKKATLLKTLRAASTARGEDPRMWDQFSTKAELVEYLAAIEPLVTPTVEQIAAKYGHKVTYTPAYHSDLQPIELVWANVKMKVARQYHPEISVEEVVRAMDKAFADLSVKTVHDCYNKAVSKEQDAWKAVEADEEDDEDDADDAAMELDDVEEGVAPDFALAAAGFAARAAAIAQSTGVTIATPSVGAGTSSGAGAGAGAGSGAVQVSAAVPASAAAAAAARGVVVDATAASGGGSSRR